MNGRDAVRTVLFWYSFWGVSSVFSAGILIFRLFTYLAGMKHIDRQAHNVASLWGKLLVLFTPGWKVEIFGQENVPKPDEACVVVANHESGADILAIYHLDFPFRWLAKDTAFKVPFMGFVMKQARYISVERGNQESRRKAMEESAQWLRQGVPMVFFPEGTRSLTGKVNEFKMGAFRLATDENVPVLPCVLKGAGKLMRKGAFIPSRATMKVRILPMVRPNPDESFREFGGRVRQMIIEVHENR